jgi:cytochrome c-type protein NapC
MPQKSSLEKSIRGYIGLYRSNRIAWIAVTAGVLIAGCASLYIGIEQTSTVAFCTSCHEMKTAHESLSASKHANVPPGKRVATCRNCHLPPWSHPVRLAIEKAYHGAKDVTRHFTDADRFGEQGYYFAMKMNAAGTIHNYNCLQCHAEIFNKKDEANFNLHPALRKNPRFECVKCHADIVHQEYLPQEIR